ncbi:MAG: nickel-dependent hydrogenase large subunit [Candidatus Lambdaproteobacteria bacterium]|nr:nickel-dependent hydrogenase large subunit [Candidatus Lambdaproteobacteria bacterium]
MAGERITIPRLEGLVHLVRDGEGILRVQVQRPRRLEARLLGRDPRDAIFLVQTIGADSGVSHALAAVLALENALGLSVPPNGFTARDLLHALSLLHAHLRHFYLQVLPDYLPLSALADYAGNNLQLARVATSLAGEGASRWASSPVRNRFTGAQSSDLVEHLHASLGMLNTLQRMLAQLGGKFPVAMTVTPGGMSIRLSEAQIMPLERRMQVISGFLSEEVLSDIGLLLQRFPELGSLGHGLGEYLSGGSLGAESGGETAMFPAGAVLNNRLVPFAGGITESLATSRYRVKTGGDGSGPVLSENDEAPPSASWIKAPRLAGRIVDVGPLARTVIAHMTAATSRQAELVAEIESRLGTSVQSANTVAGRLFARVGEMALLAVRCIENLQRLQPGQAYAEPVSDDMPDAQEAAAAIEAPGGTAWHRMGLRRGRIAYYDIVSPGTWHGAPATPGSTAGSLEVALNSAGLNPERDADRVALSRIVHSFAFSATDAVQ